MKTYSLHVSNVSRKTEDQDLGELFEKYGKISSLKLRGKEAVIVSIIHFYILKKKTSNRRTLLQQMKLIEQFKNSTGLIKRARLDGKRIKVSIRGNRSRSSSSRSPSRNKSRDQRQSGGRKQATQVDICYICRDKGHWLNK
jgi:hypothetical protein